MAKGPKVIVYSETFHRSSSSGFPQNGFNRIGWPWASIQFNLRLILAFPLN
jgi:hypothetical protein